MTILDNYLMPGVNRNDMPTVPAKSKAMRGAETTEIHPFSSLTVEEMERGLVLKAMQKMMKQKEPEREWYFYDRKFDEHMTDNVLKQTIAKHMLFAPDIATEYYSKEDALLVSLYFRTPPGRILRK
jgi:hypothetical protein